jgi:hypothetical protein
LIFSLDLQPEKTQGAIAQLVEQRTENPCVRGSTPRGTTKKAGLLSWLFLWHSVKTVLQFCSFAVVQFSAFTFTEH